MMSAASSMAGRVIDGLIKQSKMVVLTCTVWPKLYLASLMASQMASLARACSSRADGISEQPLARACASRCCELQRSLFHPVGHEYVKVCILQGPGMSTCTCLRMLLTRSCRSG